MSTGPLVDARGEPLPPTPPTLGQRLRSWWILAGGVLGTPLLLLLVPAVWGKIVDQFGAGQFKAYSDFVTDESTGQRALRVTMVNNSDELVAVRQLDFDVSSAGTVHQGVYQTRKITTTARYWVRLPDVLPSAPQHESLKLGKGHAVDPAGEDQIEVTILLPEAISVTGTYTVKPRLLIHGGIYYDLEPFAFPVKSNRVALPPLDPSDSYRPTPVE